MTKTHTLALLILALAAGSAAADEPAVKKKPKPCSEPEHRQFDFWIGEWTVDRANGKRAGTNSVTRQHGGCTLVESYTAVSPYTGTSLNFWNKATGKWHQTWIDNQGGALFLSGGLVDGSMVLASDPAESPSGHKIDRITWTPLDDGRVRQHWEVSEDDGGTWKNAFDGYYTRK